MVVHLENASIALGAMVATVWFSLVALLADPHATVALLFNGNNNFRFAD